MTTVLPLALLSAAQNPGHPFCSAGRGDAGPASRSIAYLKSQRDDGSTAEPAPRRPLTVRCHRPWRQWTRQLVRTLLPTFTFDGDTRERRCRPGRALLDDRLGARAEAAVGVRPRRLRRLADRAPGQPARLPSSPGWRWRRRTLADASTFVNRLATATQSAFRCGARPDAARRAGRRTIYVAIAAERASGTGSDRCRTACERCAPRRREVAARGVRHARLRDRRVPGSGGRSPTSVRLERHRKNLLPTSTG